MQARELVSLFPQWTLEEIDAVLQTASSDDAVFNALSARSVDDATLARYLSDTVHTPVLASSLYPPLSSSPPPYTYPEVQHNAGVRRRRYSDMNQPLLSVNPPSPL